MKLMRKFGVVLSAATTLYMVYVGASAISQEKAAELEVLQTQNAITLAGQRATVEVAAQQYLADLGADQLQCLAKNIFFEARNQSIAGQVAVAWVTLNRVDSTRYPNTICRVVQQANRDSNGNPIRNRCQFSWYCDGKSDVIPSNAIAQRAWEQSQLIAQVVLLDYARGHASPVEDATMYHADYVMPYWADDYSLVAVIDQHIFYR